MNMYYCSSPYYRSWFLWYYPHGSTNIYITRLSIFLITGVCAGFPALIWALCVLYHHHKSRGRISAIAVFLLLSDLLELLLNPLLVAYMYIQNNAACIFVVLIGVRLCGLQLHQLLALESILTLKYPSLAHFFSPTCSITLCSVVWLVGIGFQFIPSDFIYHIYLFLCVLPVIVCAVTCLVSCKASPDTNQPTDRKPGVLVLRVAMFTLIFLYVPFFVTHFTGLSFMLDCLVSMRLISEPILCVLICRETHVVETAHKQTDHTQ